MASKKKKAAPKRKKAKPSKAVWLVTDRNNDVLVFSKKPTMQYPYEGSSFETWQQGTREDALAAFCGAAFTEQTGIVIPTKPVKARVTLVKN